MIYIVNKKHFKTTGKKVVYIGRPSVLGNPFKINTVNTTREQSIQMYKQYFYEQIKTSTPFRKEVSRILNLAKIDDVYLVCWCAPLDCHGRIIKEFIETILSGILFETVLNIGDTLLC